MIIKTTVNRPTTIFVIFALLTGFGLYTALDLPVDLFPEIQPAVLMVQTSYEGAGPEEVEQSVTRIIEAVLSNVSNVKEINSFTYRGGSQVQLDFTWGTNMDEASNEVRDRLDMVKQMLPSDAGTPRIFRFDPSMIPILQLRLSGNRTPEELREIAETMLQPRLEQIEGVAMTEVSGGMEKVVRIDIPRSRLDAYNLTLTQIVQSLYRQNLQAGGGTITEGETNYIIQTYGEYTSLEDLKNTVITQKAGSGFSANIRLRDLGEVYEGFRSEKSAVYINGVPGISISVQKRSGANSVTAADNVLSRLKDIEAVLPPDVRIEVLSDSTQLIKDSLSSVSSQAIGGAVLAVIILFLFLRSLKATLVVAVSIPTSIIFTITLMYFFGLTLNLMTLAGLALGVGLLVDNSIVILENIYRYREKGAKLKPAAIFGTGEMINAIVSATLTTICVFLPIALFRNQLDFIGELFTDLAFTVVISLLSSLFVALFLVPVLSSHYFPLSNPNQKTLKGFWKGADALLDWLLSGLDRAYKRALAFTLKHKAVTLSAIVLVFAASLLILRQTGFKLMPNQQMDSVQLNARLPLGTSLDTTREIVREFENIITRDVTGYKDIIVTLGQGGNSNQGRITLNLPPFRDRERSAEEIQDQLRSYFDLFPGVEFSFRTGGMGGMMGGAPIDIRVRSNNTAQGSETAEQIRRILQEEVPEALDPQINISEGLPQVNVVIDRERAYSFGLDMAAIGQEIRANMEGVTATRFRSGGKEYDILLILDEKDKQDLAALNRITVPNSRGIPIPLYSFASFERTTGPVNIRRFNQARQIIISAGLKPGARITDVEPRIRALLDEKIPKADDVLIEFSGEYSDLMKYGRIFAGIILVAVLLVFGVMAAQFESFVDPFIIFLSIPLTLIGVLGIHWIMGLSLSLFTAVGMVMLVGIVVNNGIVLIDYTNLLRRRGIALLDACVEAGGNRLRPILMTTLTTILSLVPVAFLRGEGSELIQPIAVTVIGGLSVSTLLTLFFVPVFYASVNRFGERISFKRDERRRRKYESSETAS